MKNNQLCTRNGLMSYDPWFDFFFEPDVYPTKRHNRPLSMETDIKEEENGNYLFKINLAGVKKEDVKVDYEDGYLNVTATTKEESEDKTKYIHRERVFATSTRQFYVGDIDEKSINASLSDGVLTISVPKEQKKEETKHCIEIH